jgi:hypothetical protein
LGTAIERYRQDPVGSVVLTCLVKQTPALCARHLEKQSGWRPLVATAVAQRHGAADDPGLRPTVLAAAAVDCLNIAVDRWTDSDGTFDLEAALLDEAFDVFTPR